MADDFIQILHTHDNDLPPIKYRVKILQELADAILKVFTEVNRAKIDLYFHHHGQDYSREHSDIVWIGHNQRGPVR